MKDNNIKRFLRELRNLESINPDPVFRKNARMRLLNKISGPKIQENHPFLYRFAFLMLLFLVLPGIGVVYAAQYSLPGDPLYQIKTASEEAVLTITPPELKIYINSEIKKRRQNEQERLQKDKTKAINVLQKVIEKAPEQAIKGLEQAIESVSKQKENQNQIPDNPAAQNKEEAKENKKDSLQNPPKHQSN